MARRRSRGGLATKPGWVVILLAIAVLWTAGPAGSFTLANHPRATASDVVDDIDGTLGLNVATSVDKRTIDRLVTVTNNLGVSVTVTVTVTNSNQHDLYLNGNNVGSQASFTLGDGASQSVDVDAHPSQSLVVFDVSATAAGVNVAANGRSSNVV